MWKFLAFVLLPVLAQTYPHVVIPEDEVIKNYKAARALLTPEQEEFLMELLAADDALIESSSRGIVDDILQAISGTGSNIRVNVVGGSNPASAPAPTNNNQQQPTVNILNPTFTLVGNGMNVSTDANTLIKNAVNSAVNSAVSGIYNSSTSNSGGNTPMLLADISSSISVPSSSQGAAIQAGTTAAQQMQSNITTIGGNNNHLFQTISSVIRNSNARNVTGIVDESLRIATPAPIREFVTGILNVVYCNGIRRLLGRC